MRSKSHTFPVTHPLLSIIGEEADKRSVEVYVVGGYVRDLLLGRDDMDVDILVVGDGVQFAQEVAPALGTSTVVMHKRFGTAMLPLSSGKVEFVGARSEKYELNSRKPTVIAGSLQDDLSRRDFTVNAMALGLNKERFGRLFDPLGGKSDLERKILRTPLEPSKTFEDDPLRIMRAVRFASQLEFAIDPLVYEAITAQTNRLRIVSQERITDEFFKILSTKQPSIGLRLLFDTGVLEVIFPEIASLAGIDQRRDHHHKDVFLHTCQVVDNVARASNNLWLRFASLVHDIAKPRTKSFKEGIGWTFHGHEELGARMMPTLFRRLRLPLERLSYVQKLTRLHLRPMALVVQEVTDSAVRRLIVESGEELDDLMLLCRADITSKNPSLVARYLRNYDVVMEKIKEVEEKDRLRNWRPPIDGREIMEVCGIPPGKKVGLIKKSIEEAILEGTIPNDHDAALAYLMKIKASLTT